MRLKFTREEKDKSSGPGFLSILGLIFITLKLTGNIDWSWWWATAPFWGGLVVAVVLLIIVLLAKLIIRTVEEW